MPMISKTETTQMMKIAGRLTMPPSKGDFVNAAGN